MHSFSQSLDMPFLPPKNSLFTNKGELISVECPGIPVGDCKDSFCSNPGLLEHFFDEFGGKQCLWNALAYLLATVKTASVATLAFSFSPKVTTGLKAKGFKGNVNLLRDTTSESIT